MFNLFETIELQRFEIVSDILIYAVVSLSILGSLLALILYFVAQKFKVIEDPKIDLVEDVLPAANCGGCGYAGCRNFAEALVAQAAAENSIEGLNCPVGGSEVMQDVAGILGLEVADVEPMIAVVRCNGSFANAPLKVQYDGPATCGFAHNLYAGTNGCQFGCLGLGDCVESCTFDAIHMDPETGLPVVNEKCVACGACVKACPRGIIELRNKGKKDRRIYVCCINEEKGGPARKNCSVACIGCGKCVEVCPFEAITLENNLAYIDYEKCRLCRKCTPVCPTNAIHELNFPPRKEPKESIASGDKVKPDKPTGTERSTPVKDEKSSANTKNT
jgi:Na+-translocating ferredoxin:NAD+ oxidoreductase RNF subunit RnfB